MPLRESLSDVAHAMDEQNVSVDWSSARSLLVWGLGANAAFGLSFLLLFSALRRTRVAQRWYAPRLHASLAHDPALHGGHLQPVEALGARSWLSVLRVSEERLLAQAGLDAVVYVRLFDFSAKLFTLLSLLLVPALCPWYFKSRGAPLDAHGHVAWTTALSLANLPRGSPLLWLPLAASYLTTALTLALLRREYKHVSALRLRQLCSRQAVPEAYALLCVDIPGNLTAAQTQDGESMEAPRGGKAVRSLARAAESAADLAQRAAVSVATGHTVTAPSTGAHAHAIEAEWRRLHPGAEVKAVCVPYLPPVEAAYRAWREAKGRASDAMLQERRDSAELHQEGLREPLLNLHDGLQTASEAVSLWRRVWTGAPRGTEAIEAVTAARAALIEAQEAAQAGPSSTAFLLFRSRRAACTAIGGLLDANPLHWQLRAAPAPGEIVWVNLRLRWWERRVRGIWATSVSALITLFFLAPITAISSLPSLSRLTESLPVVGGAAESYLPGLALTAALSLVPLAFGHLARRQGCVSMSDTDRQVSGRVFAVLVLDVFLGSTVARATVNIIATLSSLQWDVSLSDVLALLGTSVSNNAPLFMGLLAVRALAGLPLELSRLVPMLLQVCTRTQASPLQPLPYGTQVPNALLVVLLGVAYAPIAPVLLPFAALFFLLGAAVWRYQVLFVYQRQYESNGAWFPHIANRILACLTLSHATLAAVMALKLAAAVPLPGRHHLSPALWAGPALLPLPVTVALFARHYRRRFAPIFKRVPLTSAAEMGDAEDGWCFADAWVPPCMRPPRELDEQAQPDSSAVPVGELA